MRPPMQAAALQQNEGYPQQLHLHATPTAQQQQHPQLQTHSPLLEPVSQPQQFSHKGKLQPLELLVEHKLSYAYQQQEQQHSQTPVGSQISRSSSSDECRASIFDDAAENFIINFPADSSQPLLPLSETVPLLTHIEATVVDKQRSIRLSKNSASLIFTKKDLQQSHNGHSAQPGPASGNRRQHQHHQSLYGAGERPRKQTKHLPPTRAQQQQRRSLPLSSFSSSNSNYNNNLVTTASCAAAGSAGNSGHCCSSSNGKVVLHKSHAALTSPTGTTGSGSGSGSGSGGSTRKQLSYSWYAPVYSALEEELEQDSRDSSPIHNLANTKHQQQPRQPTNSAAQRLQQQRASYSATSHDANETVALLETRNRINISAEGEAGERKAAKAVGVPHSLSLSLQHASSEGGGGGGNGAGIGGGIGGIADVEGSLGLAGGPLPRRRRFENFLKSLVGLKGSSSNRDGGGGGSVASSQRPASPEIRITRTPSEQDVVLRHPAGRQLANGKGSNGGSTSSLNVVHQKLWHMVRREGSASSLHQEKSQSIVQYTGLRKCETVLALTRQSHSLHPAACSVSTGSGIYSASGVEQIRPLNRLRNSVGSINAATCSRCSSILSLAGSGSRYSLANGFVARPDSAQSLPQRRASVSFNTTADVVDANAGEEQEPHINVNAQIRLSGGSRKSSAGAQSASSLSPPSNVTTATLHSNNAMPAPNREEEEELERELVLQLATPTPPPELGAFGTTHAYPLTVSSLLSMATANQAAQACCVRDGIALKRREMLASADVTPSADAPAFQPFTCKLCLLDVETLEEATTLLQCGCQFCTECMRAYVDFEISEGAYEISCPDAKCPAQGALTLPQIANLTTTNLLKKHHRYRLNREIELDKSRTWCPRAGCETICVVGGAICHIDESPSTSATSQSFTPQLEVGGAIHSVAVQCPSCKDEFCALCKKAYHANISCEEFGRRLIADGQDDIGIPFDNELIKCCPMCAVPIEKDEGCAQMMCKRCKHVFCWYCLASLDDDFLLRHYDKGPCKNKLGHSRASVVWHRAQVIGIFAGFGILLLVASPLLLLAAPCIICCKCRGCSGSKIDEVDGELEEEVTALQG